MSNGQSKAPYIIICGGRIEVFNAKSPEDSLVAASNAATRLVSFYGDKLTAAETAPISQLQHDMMDNFDLWDKEQMAQAVKDMFVLLDALEDSHEEHEY